MEKNLAGAAYVTYVLVQRGNPLKPTEPKKWYAQFVNNGVESFELLCKEVATTAGTSPGAVKSIIDSVFYQVCLKASQGIIVELAQFGSFHIVMESEGSDTREGFNSTYIKKGRLVYFPGNDIKNMEKALQFTLVEGGTSLAPPPFEKTLSSGAKILVVPYKVAGSSEIEYHMEEAPAEGQFINVVMPDGSTQKIERHKDETGKVTFRVI